MLGQGGFGVVYLAHDEQLSRPVAIKVPHRWLVADRKVAESYLAEARMVANLHHPHIVPVFDVGSSDEYPSFIVSKYNDGTDLFNRLKQSRLSIRATVELVATTAEALHYAHKHGLVHRDIKPEHLLLDRAGKPFVSDFGLALREHDFGTGPQFARTLSYMSSKQARGEGHRVDGRTDLFSLGVVLYEMLVGKRPFRSDSQRELLEQIKKSDPRPPRQYNDDIPKELDRICLKALSKRASERYSTARDLADDLRYFLRTHEDGTKSGEGDGGRVGDVERKSSIEIAPSASRLPSPSNLMIVPKGLRSFDAHDADFFLELLPGPRNREGLPDGLRFWKTGSNKPMPITPFQSV